VSNTPGNPGNLLELFFLLEILEISWNFTKSPGNFVAVFGRFVDNGGDNSCV